MYVGDFGICGQKSINDRLVQAIQKMWKTGAPGHVGPDAESDHSLRLLGVNLERANSDMVEISWNHLDAPVRICHQEPLAVRARPCFEIKIDTR